MTKASGGWRDPVQTYALALGCEVTHANELVYADDLDLSQASSFEPIGISCRICERRDCHQRAVPPLKRKLHVDANDRGADAKPDRGIRRADVDHADERDGDDPATIRVRIVVFLRRAT